MTTECNSPKIQPGPNLRAAIANLPATGHTDLRRDRLAHKDVGYILFHVWDELNEIGPRLSMIEAGHEVGEREEWPDLKVGVMHAANDIRDSVERARSLIKAIWIDLEGRPVAEGRS